MPQRYPHLRHLIRVPTLRQFHAQQAQRAKFLADLEAIARGGK
jgi:hypothetical protein